MVYFSKLGFNAHIAWSEPAPDWSRERDWAETEENCTKQCWGKGQPPFLKQMQREEQGDTSLCCWQLSVNQWTTPQVADGYAWLQDVIGELQLKEHCLSQCGKQQGHVWGWMVMPSDGKRWEGWKGFSLICSVKKPQSRNRDVFAVPAVRKLHAWPCPLSPCTTDTGGWGWGTLLLHFSQQVTHTLLLPGYLPAGNLWVI